MDSLSIFQCEEQMQMRAKSNVMASGDFVTVAAIENWWTWKAAT